MSNALKSKFVPGISCRHAWRSLDQSERYFGCDECGATCSRGDDTQIVEYTYGAPLDAIPRSLKLILHWGY